MARPLRKGARLLLYLIIQSPAAKACSAWFRPGFGESEAKPESRVAGHLERMPKEASRYAQALPLERQGQVPALVLQPLVHNVLLNPLILLVESPLAKAAKEASPPRAKAVEASPPGAVENTD